MESNWTLYPRMGLRSPNFTNTTGNLQESFEMELEDTNWILTSSFIIFTMQTGQLYSFHYQRRHLNISIILKVSGGTGLNSTLNFIKRFNHSTLSGTVSIIIWNSAKLLMQNEFALWNYHEFASVNHDTIRRVSFFSVPLRLSLKP